MTSSTSPQCLVVWSSPQITASLCSDTSLGSTPTLISLKLSISVPVAPGYQIIWINEELFSANYLNTSVSWSIAPVSKKVLFYPCWTQSSSLSHSLRPDQSLIDSWQEKARWRSRQARRGTSQHLNPDISSHSFVCNILMLSDREQCASI